MKLRSHILVCMSATIAMLMLGVYIFASKLLMQSYTRLELQDTTQNVERANLAFSQLTSALHDKSVDWASWDDTYQFMADHNKAYIKSNLVSATIAAMKLDLLLYVDAHGKIFHSFTFKRFPELPPPDPKYLWYTLNLDRADSPAFRNAKPYFGVVLHPQCPLMVSVRPILNSNGAGIPRGWLVFGRYFDDGQLTSLAEQTRLNVESFRVDSNELSGENRQILASLSSKTPIQIRHPSIHKISGFAQILDVQNHPAILLKIVLPRRIYQQGLASTRILIRFILLAALIFTVVIHILFESSVLSRLSRLTMQVDTIGKDCNSSKRVHLNGRDELAWLAERINEMLLKMDRFSSSLSQSQEELRVQNDSLESIIEIRTASLYETQETLRRQNENLEAIVEERTHDLVHQAFHDSLTNLPNRAKMLSLLHQIAEAKNGGGYAVLFIDLDNFKFINDSLGHQAGDELLIAVAARLKKCVRSTDIVARLGGDEFIILIEKIGKLDSAIVVAEKVLGIMNSGFTLSAGEGFTSASIGIAYTDSIIIDPDILIRDADTAMYHAKSEGKAGYTIFESGMNDRLTERIEMELGLRTALTLKQFCIHYQPLVDLKTGHMLGVEALVRWIHPEKGMISPAKFIPIAEETGLIIPIGYWVLEEACRQTAAWKQLFNDYGNFTLSVNLSGKQLQKPDVVERIKEILDKTGLSAKYLKIEITESVIMVDTESTILKLSQLRSLGIKLAMDDFGTGYSSVASMSSFPLDTVKIDRSFINRLNTHPDANAVVAAIILLAKSLSLDITAEGIETAEQVIILQGLGCDVGQGYFFDRPLTAEDLSDNLKSGANSFVQNGSETEKELIERMLAEFDASVLQDFPEAA